MSKSWRQNQRLAALLHPDFPDDLMVIIHDGDPRVSGVGPEAMWVRILEERRALYRGQLLNEPNHLTSVKLGDAVTFIVPQSGPYPVQVRHEYLTERRDWIIHPCDTCGLTELLSPPSVLIPRLFDLPPDATMEVFTSRCFCGGAQLVHHKGFQPDG